MIKRAADIVPLIIMGLPVAANAITPPTNMTHVPAISNSGGGKLLNKTSSNNFYRPNWCGVVNNIFDI